MRIAQVVTLVTPDGAYGGPLRVAINQSRSLIEAGHEVVLFGGVRGYVDVPREIDGVPVRLSPVVQLVPGTGFAGLTSHGMLRGLKSDLHRFDAVHIHLARDLVTLPAGRAAAAVRKRYVVQTHGMIDSPRNPLAFPLDALVTRKVLRSAFAVFHLTDSERDDLRDVSRRDLPFVHLPNGVPDQIEMSPEAKDLASPEVLFLARLHRRKRPTDFIRMAQTLVDEFPHARFTLVGPDEGEGSAVRQLIASSPSRDRITWAGAIGPDETIARMRRAAVYVLPSIDEPFPMSVLEALSVGLPTVITKSNGLADALRSTGAGIVVEPSLNALTTAVRELLASDHLRARYTAKARIAARTMFSMDAVAARLIEVYGRAAGHHALASHRR